MISADRQTEEAGLYLQAESNNSRHPSQEFPPPPGRVTEAYVAFISRILYRIHRTSPLGDACYSSGLQVFATEQLY
ncbi:hypothetical protein Q5P01_015881 [Channa striata]|uniref:Uncharacterized protein n=1 Tax=Channa striata TaxID=64152 RepID=A0AA88MFW1_CHASR|nr:hypothetical protein Q5P01_015881 [Channa striata]